MNQQQMSERNYNYCVKRISLLRKRGMGHGVY